MPRRKHRKLVALQVQIAYWGCLANMVLALGYSLWDYSIGWLGALGFQIFVFIAYALAKLLAFAGNAIRRKLGGGEDPAPTSWMLDVIVFGGLFTVFFVQASLLYVLNYVAGEILGFYLSLIYTLLCLRLYLLYTSCIVFLLNKYMMKIYYRPDRYGDFL